MRKWLAAIALLSSPSAHSAELPGWTAKPITIGNAHTIVSVPMGEVRAVNVVLPARYAKEPEKRYPVLYLIDGGFEQDLLHVSGALHLGSVWGRAADAIVVGIETKDRRKELVGPTRDAELLRRYPTAGSSGLFREFIRAEVKPLVDGTYRTSGHDAVIGESLAGLFILETYLNEPTLFDSYAAIDPSLWWDKEALSKDAAVKAAAARNSKPLYVAIAKEQAETPAAVNRVTDAIKGKAAQWCLALRPDLLHSTIYQQLTPQALQFLLPPPKPSAAEFGFNVQCSQQSPAHRAGIRP